MKTLFIIATIVMAADVLATTYQNYLLKKELKKKNENL